MRINIVEVATDSRLHLLLPPKVSNVPSCSEVLEKFVKAHMVREMI